MKETKVYVDELPKCCRNCVFCYDNRPYWKSTDCIINHKELDEDEIEIKREKDCSLVDIKTYNRELVKEVCDKFSKWCKNIKNLTYDSNHRVIDLHNLYEFLKQLQKEFEK